jgi:hypothetical protein
VQGDPAANVGWWLDYQHRFDSVLRSNVGAHRLCLDQGGHR